MQSEILTKTRMTLKDRILLEASGFSGKIGIYADDFKGNVIRINADEEWETASCIKVLILAELMRQVAEGQVSLDDTIQYEEHNNTTGSGILRALTPGLSLSLRDMATLMIIVSDNVATNVMIDFLGIDRINEMGKILGLAKTQLLRKLYFPPEGIKLGITTPEEYGEIFRIFYEKRYGTEDVCNEFFTILKKQKYNTMFTQSFSAGLMALEDEEENSLIQIASKSGSLRNCRNDGGIFFTPWGDYLACIFTKDFSDEHFHNDHESYKYGSRISRLLFDHYLSKGGSFAD